MYVPDKNWIDFKSKPEEVYSHIHVDEIYCIEKYKKSHFLNISQGD
jgi:hypothetical protein